MHRRKAEVVARWLGLFTYENVLLAVGSKWAYRLRDAIRSVNLVAEHGGAFTYPDAKTARADGHNVPQGHTGPVRVEGPKSNLTKYNPEAMPPLKHEKQQIDRETIAACQRFFEERGRGVGVAAQVGQGSGSINPRLQAHHPRSGGGGVEKLPSVHGGKPNRQPPHVHCPDLMSAPIPLELPGLGECALSAQNKSCNRCEESAHSHHDNNTRNGFGGSEILHLGGRERNGP